MGSIRDEFKNINNTVDMKKEPVRATEFENTYMVLRFLSVGSTMYNKSTKDITEEEKSGFS